MSRARRIQVIAALVGVSLCALLVYQSRPQLYIYNPLQLLDGVPEMQSSPILACPPTAVQQVVLQSPADDQTVQRVYVITPTYPRAVQVPEMTRLAQTLMLTSNVFWIVTEDAERQTPAVAEILLRSGIPHVHILGLKPEMYRKGYKGTVPRGVSNRMAALEWLRNNADSGVFYFADDDNTYDFRLFAELAKTRRASAFPVGLVTQAGLSTPIVKDGVVTGFYDGWIGSRTFPMDMAGFAISVQLLLERPDAKMPFTPGYEEDGFLKSLKLTKDDMEPLADNCTKILVWHTQTKQPKMPFTRIDPEKYRSTNLETLRVIVNPRVILRGPHALRRVRPAHPSPAKAAGRSLKPPAPPAKAPSPLKYQSPLKPPATFKTVDVKSKNPLGAVRPLYFTETLNAADARSLTQQYLPNKPAPLTTSGSFRPMSATMLNNPTVVLVAQTKALQNSGARRAAAVDTAASSIKLRVAMVAPSMPIRYRVIQPSSPQAPPASRAPQIPASGPDPAMRRGKSVANHSSGPNVPPVWAPPKHH